MQTVKQEAEQLVRALSDEATWDDLLHTIVLHRKIAQGEQAADAGQVVDHEEVKRRFARP
jgi:predicted transcriptional regulator